MGMEFRRSRLFSFINIPRRPLRGRGTRARASARGSACATDPCGASVASGTAFGLLFAPFMFIFFVTRLGMADAFANGPDLFGDDQVRSRFLKPSFAAEPDPLGVTELEGGLTSRLSLLYLRTSTITKTGAPGQSATPKTRRTAGSPGRSLTIAY